MLEFSTAPYQFFPPQPSAPVVKFSEPLNRFLLRFDLGIREIDISGSIDEVKALIESGARILFTPNHPSRTDPQLTGEIQRQLGTNSSFMAAYDIFLENRIRRWFMQKTGCFSIDREGNDRKSLSTAINILKEGKRSLTIFPEGNVYHLNDRITPILDGPAFIAAKAQQGLKETGEVWIVPISIKYSYIKDVRPRIWKNLQQIARDSNYSQSLDRDDPIDCVRSLGAHLISQILATKTDLNHQVDFREKSAEEIQDEIYSLARKLTADLEHELDLETEEETFILDRIRKIRSRVHNLRTEDQRPDDLDHTNYSSLVDRSIFTFRLLAYVLPYLSEKPTIDRFAETVARIREDYYSKHYGSLGHKKGFAKIGKPLSVGKILQECGGKTKAMIPLVTRKIEETLQSGVDDLNEKNTEIGGQLLH